MLIATCPELNASCESRVMSMLQETEGKLVIMRHVELVESNPIGGSAPALNVWILSV